MTRDLTRARDERGNIIVVMAVIMVLLFLSIAVVARTASGLHSTRQGQDFSAALANADAGLSDALFRIDQLGNDAGRDLLCGQQRRVHGLRRCPVPRARSTRRAASTTTPTRCTSKGIVNGQPHAIQATRRTLVPLPVRDLRQDLHHVQRQQRELRPGRRHRTGRDRRREPATSCSRRPPTSRATVRSPATAPPPPRTSRTYFDGGGTNCDNGYLLAGHLQPAGSDARRARRRSTSRPRRASRRRTTRARRSNGVLPAALTPGVYYCSQSDLTGGSLSFPSTFTVGAGLANGGVGRHLHHPDRQHEHHAEHRRRDGQPERRPDEAPHLPEGRKDRSGQRRALRATSPASSGRRRPKR